VLSEPGLERTVGDPDRPAISEASDLDHWRQRTVDALLETLDEGDSDGQVRSLANGRAS
jgi:hypothetical protein